MKWKSKQKEAYKSYKIGDKRIVTRFAWRVTRIGDYKVWLEDYHSTEELQEVLIPDLSPYGFPPMAKQEWVEVYKEIKWIDWC